VSGNHHTIHRLSPDAFAYAWDRDLEPALEVSEGEAFLLHARDAANGQIGRDSSALEVTTIDLARINPVSGPVFVRGARPGDTLAVELLEFIPSGWGWTALIPGFGLLADEFPEPWLRISAIDADAGLVHFSERIRLPLAAFPGTIGVAPPEPGQHPILPPRRWGGNLDIRHLVAGTTLYLPVGVDGALLSVGDTHAAQGDGEVCGTAIETAMDVVLRVSVLRDRPITAPQFTVPAPRAADISPVNASSPQAPTYACTGVAPDLIEASRDAVRAMIDHLTAKHRLDRAEAYALISVAGDLRIHELVDAPNWVVGVMLPESVLLG
jgi:acetamidase/formamidase